MAPKTQQQIWFEQALDSVDGPVRHNIMGMPVELKPEDVEGLVPSITKTPDNEAPARLVMKTYGPVKDADDDDSLNIGGKRIIRDLSVHNPFLVGDKTNERTFLVVELTPAQATGLYNTVAKERLALRYQAIRDAAVAAQTELVNRQTTALSPDVQAFLGGMGEVADAADQAARDLEQAEVDAAKAHTAKLEAMMQTLVEAVSNANA